MTKLTGKQRPFVIAYLSNGFNATQAAITAGYSEKTAAEMGYENLRKPHIAAAIEEYMSALAMSAKEVLMRLSQHASATMGDFLNELGEIDLVKARTAGKLHLLKKVQIADTELGKRISIELHDQQGALALLGRHHGLFVDRVETTGKEGGAIEHKLDLSGVSTEQLLALKNILKD